MHFQDQCGSVGIRPFQSGDVLAHFLAIRESLDALLPWMNWCQPDYSQDDCRSFVLACRAGWKNGTDYTFAIYDVRDQMHLGSIGLNHLQRDNNFANLGYWVRTSRAGQGVATIAARLVAQFGFREIALGRVEIVVATENVASRRVAEKLGAHLEGCSRNRLVHHGESRDAFMYSLIPGDFLT